MAFASFDSRNGGAPMSEINMVPLIDVMLVLLVIFIVTAPLLTQAVKLELPKASSQAKKRFLVEGKKPTQPEVHLKADQGVAYRFVAQTLADASKAGLTKVGFISEAEPEQ
jgi:biopolymer transport protein ExbD